MRCLFYGWGWGRTRLRGKAEIETLLPTISLLDELTMIDAETPTSALLDEVIVTHHSIVG